VPLLFAFFKQHARKAALPNDGQKRADLDLSMLGDWNGDGAGPRFHPNELAASASSYPQQAPAGVGIFRISGEAHGRRRSRSAWRWDCPVVAH